MNGTRNASSFPPNRTQQLPAAIASVLGTLQRLPADTPLRNIAFTLNCERRSALRGWL
jgi:hypothetical protein